MKKLFVVPAIALGLLFSTQTISAQDENSNESSEMVMQDDYNAIASENLPQPVTDAVAKDFPGATVNSASAKEDGSDYKLILTKESGEAVEVHCDSEGNWVTK